MSGLRPFAISSNFGSAETALAALPELSARGGATRSIRIATESEAHKELEAARRFGARFVGIGEPEYPQALKQVDGAPPLLAVKGNLAVSSQPGVGIVGSRNASISGAKFAATRRNSASICLMNAMFSCEPDRPASFFANLAAMG